MRKIAFMAAGGDAPKAEKRAATESQGTAGALGDLFGGFKGAISKKLSGGESKPAGEGPFFSSTTEVKTVHAEPIPADTFEIPSSYVKN